MVGMAEAMDITGLATVISGMVIIIITIAISSRITAAGSGALTARSTSATAIIDPRSEHQLARAERSGRAFDSVMSAGNTRPGSWQPGLLHAPIGPEGAASATLRAYSTGLRARERRTKPAEITGLQPQRNGYVMPRTFIRAQLG